MTALIAQYFLNHRLEPAQIEWQVEELARQGYQGVYAHARPGLLTPYFSDAWWQAIDTMMAACRRSGLEFWIWDEDYFPSGLCGGRVVGTDAGLAARQLEFTLAEVEGAGPFEVDFAPGLLLRAFAIPQRSDGTAGPMVDVTRCCGTRRQRWGARFVLHRAYSPLIDRVGHPHWRAEMEDNRFALVWQPEEPGRYLVSAALVQNLPTTHPDLLRPEGIALFLALSHEEYAARYPGEMGSVIGGSFTDEPSPGAWTFPWSARLPEEFRSDHGYELLDYLPHLASDLDETSAVVRHHYRLTQHRLQTANYVAQMAKWCHGHGIKLAGHLTRTEWLSLVSAWWPNELRCYEPMDIPCCDPLGASEGGPESAAYHSGLKVASSAAHLFGKAQAGSDCVAVIGDEASLRDLRYHFDYQMVLGINHFVVHGLSYSNDGPRKDEVPPSIFYQHTEWQHMGVLLDRVGRTCAELTGGRHVCELAVLYPSTSLACQLKHGGNNTLLDDEPAVHALVEALLSHHRDFDFIDEVALQEQVGADGRLATPEPYSTILLPYLRAIDERSAEALLRFAAGGGRVIVVGHVPRALCRDLAAPQREWATAAVECHGGLDDLLLASLPGVSVAGEGARDVFVLQRDREDGRRTFAFNRREGWFHGTVAGAAVTIPPRAGILLSPTAPDLGEVVMPAGADALDVSGGWTVEFDANHVPLSFWHVLPGGAGAAAAVTGGPGFDLMRREPDPAGEGSEPVTYCCRFMLTGGIADARLVMEDSTLAGDWQVTVNGVPIAGWARATVFDCYNLQAPVGDALRGGTTPTLNVVRVETRGPGRGLHEVPYLYGTFRCAYRYAHLSLPFLEGYPGLCEVTLLQPWQAAGYPTFSGTATYRRSVEVPQTGDWVLDLGKVEDCAVVAVDGREVAVLPWPPYRCRLPGLAAGRHELSVAVSNPPANRNRAAGLIAGLLGPVRLGLTDDTQGE